MNKVISTLASFMALSPITYGQEAPSFEKGKQQFQTYCAACHGLEGQGGAGDSAPALAKSDWLQGDADRAIKIVLHGLQGELEVNGKHFNLVMPPQGAMLNDQQIADILSYTRASWGNKAAAVTVQKVAEVRKANESQASMWKTEELLKAHPLPQSKNPLTPGPVKDLIMSLYKGNWSEMPDFKKLEAEAMEEEHGGYLSLEKIGRKSDYAAVWEGRLDIPQDGEYTFKLQSDDGSALYLNEKLIAQIKGEGGLNRKATKKVQLQKGEQDFRFEYFQNKGDQGIILNWSGPGVKRAARNITKSGKKGRSGKRPPPMIDLTPKGSEAVMYRNFLQGTSHRNVAFGYPGGINLAFSQEHCQLELLWKGSFLSGGRHWTARGQGATEPLSKEVFSLMAKPGLTGEGNHLQLEKIGLDENRYPTFHYHNQQIKVEDRPDPTAEGIDRVFKIVATEAIPDFSLQLLNAKNPKLEITSAQSQSADGLHFKMPLQKGLNTFTFHYRIK